MVKGLRPKFLLLLLGVALLSLCSALAVRELMLRDFASYLEGEKEDKVYWILAHLEGSFDRSSGWRLDTQAEDALWALNLGFEMKLRDRDGKPVMDTEQAIATATPLVKKRLKALSDYRAAGPTGDFMPYPLFLGGVQIGTLELRELKPAKESLFVRRSDLFLLASLIVLGGLAALLSILLSRRLTKPILELSKAASAISRGDYTKRVEIRRRDEVGDLSDVFNRMGNAIETHETLRRKLIADVAHELRTPLGVMRGELEAMLDGLMPNDPERLQSLYDETGRLKHVVDAIEELNQAEAGRLSLKRQDLPLGPFLANIAERFKANFKEKGVSLDLVHRGEPVVWADPERLSQIVLNLLSNALKAAPSGGHVRIIASKEQSEGLLAIEDDGPGIRPQDLPLIFERFYKGPAGGLGIGLTIVKELTEAHGGKVEVTSVLGKGASFLIHLPAAGLHNSS
ncbi:MAG TPA: ATP-binding protein [Syntrophorhabdaceae bacterium]|jgi:two-component system sensor histidine kinase BaeS